MDSLLNGPAFVKIFVYETDLISRMPVGYRLLINIDIDGNYFLCHFVKIETRIKKQESRQ